MECKKNHPRTTDQSNAFFDCLFDKAEKPLKFLPDGIKLNFRALPHFETTVNKMERKKVFKIDHDLYVVAALPSSIQVLSRY